MSQREYSEPSILSDPGATRPAGKWRALLIATLIGLVALGGQLLLLYQDRAKHRMEQQRVALSLADGQANQIIERLNGAMSSTYALATVLRQHDYKPDYAWMEPFARELLRYHPGTSNLQFSPEGITRYIVPLAGNEKAVGNNLLVRNDRNREALLAVESRKLTLAGPFDLRQGGTGLAGRLPVFKGEGKPDDPFWGFAVALVLVDHMLKSTDIERLEREGYDYLLWRKHPDTGMRHVFSRSGPVDLPDGVTLPFEVINGTWHLTLQPRKGWLTGAEREYNIRFVLALAIAVLAGWLSFRLLRQPDILRAEVEHRTAALTLVNQQLDYENRQRKEAEASLKLSDEVISATAEGIMITDDRQHVVRINRAFTRITGYSEEDVLGKSPSILNSGRHDAAFFADMFEAILHNGSWQGEIWNRRKNGEVFPQWVSVSVLRNAQGEVTHYVSIGSDISERKEAEERIHHLANYDALTGLPNRLLLRDRFQQGVALAVRNQSKLALLQLDLDRFKVINDTLGHQVGDELLRQVVARLKAVIRSSDTISRQGGDEFVILTQDHEGLRAATLIAHNIHLALKTPFRIVERDISISASIGIALYPDDGEDFDTLSKKSDIAMYHAKESGRGTHRFFTEELNVDSADRIQMEAELRGALERNEFILHFQPQVDLASGQVTGAEALIRWQHPGKGMIPPGRFIPLAEETGLIVPMDNWVMREACRQARTWVAEGLPALMMSINLSGLQFRQTDLVERVRAVLDDTGQPADCLEVELTESVLIHDVEKVLVTLAQIKALGVRLAIDDFGTGYSSLAYLKRFAVDKLKIDQSFVRGTTAEDAAIVAAVIQLGHSLNLKTIAEGAETAEHVRSLKDKGCLEVQGYYFSKPLPADEFAAFVRSTLAHRTGGMSA